MKTAFALPARPATTIVPCAGLPAPAFPIVAVYAHAVRSCLNWTWYAPVPTFEDTIQVFGAFCGNPRASVPSAFTTAYHTCAVGGIPAADAATRPGVGPAGGSFEPALAAYPVPTATAPSAATTRTQRLSRFTSPPLGFACRHVSRAVPRPAAQ